MRLRIFFSIALSTLLVTCGQLAAAQPSQAEKNQHVVRPSGAPIGPAAKPVPALSPFGGPGPQTQAKPAANSISTNAKPPVIGPFDQSLAKTSESSPARPFRNYRLIQHKANSRIPDTVLLNPGFEANPASLDSWSSFVQPGSFGSWFVQTGTVSPLNSFPVQPPPEGIHAAMNDEGGPATHILYQDFIVPANAVLSFDLYARSQIAWIVPVPESLDYTAGANQHIRVDIMDPTAAIEDVGAGVLQNLFITDPVNDPLEFGYITVTADLSRFAGRLVRLRFAAVLNQFFLNTGIDNVVFTAPQQGIGLVADNASSSVIAFDPNTDTVTGVVPIPLIGSPIGAVAISKDGTLGFVTNFANQIYVLDLTVSPPVLAGGTNPILISNVGEDLSITADGKYLLSTNPGISIVDIASRTEIGTNGAVTVGIQACPDNSVLAADYPDGVTRRFTIDSAGTLTDTGETLTATQPMNAACGFRSTTALIPEFSPGQVQSVGIPGMGLLDTEPLSSGGQTVVVNGPGNRVFVRHSDCVTPSVNVFDYDSASGAITPTGIFIPLTPFTPPALDCWFGIDQMALHPYGKKLYVSDIGKVNVYNPVNGGLLTTITDPAIQNPTGIAVFVPPPAQLGLIADGLSSNVLEFDASNDEVIGSVPVPSSFGLLGDVAISKDGKLGFVTNFLGQVHVLDLSVVPLTLAAGTNPIAISQPGEDLSLTPDGNYLVSCDGSGQSVMSVIDIAGRTESSTFPAACNGVEVCSDNSVLIVDFDTTTARRLTINGAGTLADTGESIGDATNNVGCVPGSAFGLTGSVFSDNVSSFSIPGLTLADSKAATGEVQTMLTNRAGNTVYTLSCQVGSGVNEYDFNRTTGALNPTISFPASQPNCWFGIEQMALHPLGGKLYVSETNAVNVYNTSTGGLMSSITDPLIQAPTGVTVYQADNAPLANDDSFSTNEDTPLSGNVTSNDVDAENDPLTAFLDTNPGNGIVTFNSDGSFTYTPNPNFNGSDTFTYHLNDGFVDSNIAAVNITVIPVNDPPVASNDSIATDEDTPLNFAAPGVLANDTDIDGNPLTAVLNAGPTHGTLVLTTNGSLIYTPNANYNGPDSFTYHANDGSANSNVATVSITVTPVNDAPAASDDSYSTNKNVALVIAAPGVLNNDPDVDGDTLSAVLNAGPSNGGLTLNSDGSFTYTPDTNFVGTDTFTYHANDGTADSNVATVTITVNETCLFCDYFDDGVFPTGWTITKGTWVETGGDLTNTTPKKNLIAATPVFAGCLTCSAETRFSTSDPKAKLGMLTQYIDKKNGMELLIKMSGKVLLKQRILGHVVAKGKGTATFLPNTLYKARVAFDGTQFSVFIDDVLLFTLTPGGTVQSGTVGFESKSAGSNFDYIDVE